MIYGIGAYYDGVWMNEEFINAGVACVGYPAEDHPEIHEHLKDLAIGDIVYQKAFGASSECLTIMGIGVVTDNNVIRRSEKLGYGVGVDWVYKGDFELKKSMTRDKHRNVRTGTFFREYSPAIQKQVVKILLNPKPYESDESDED